MPKVSIIVPVYNAEKAIARLIDSVLAQEYEDFELLLMNDGSKDGTAAILDEYAAKDSRIKVVHKENSGVSDTRNQALKMAQGEYIQFADADDWITKDATKLFVRAMEEQDCDMVISDFYRVVGENTAIKGDIEDSGLLTREEYSDRMLMNPADYYYGVIWNKMFKREIIEKEQLKMDPELKWCEDFIFNMEYILHAKNIFVLKVPTYYYVKTEGSLVWSGMNMSNVVRMKLSVIEYYNDFYKNLYDDRDYALRKPAIYGFLLDFAKDDFASSIMPGTKKLGEEGVPVKLKEGDEENVFTHVYYMEKQLEQYLYTAGLPFELSLRDMKLLSCIGTGKREIGELADFIGENRIVTMALLEKLLLRRFVDFDREGLTIRISAAASAEPVLAAIRQAEADFKDQFEKGLVEFP